MDQALLVVLLSWASHLSGYPMPSEPEVPEVRFEPHSFFVEHVCGGRECNVGRWYNGADVVYIDNQYDCPEEQTVRKQAFVAGLVVHEFTHYLQDKSGRFDTLDCEDSRQREREAYYVQNRYIVEALARIDTIYPGPTICNYTASLGEKVS